MYMCTYILGTRYCWLSLLHFETPGIRTALWHGGASPRSAFCLASQLEISMAFAAGDLKVNHLWGINWKITLMFLGGIPIHGLSSSENHRTNGWTLINMVPSGVIKHGWKIPQLNGGFSRKITKVSKVDQKKLGDFPS